MPYRYARAIVQPYPGLTQPIWSLLQLSTICAMQMKRNAFPLINNRNCICHMDMQGQ
jgi:hypothetical protein